MTHYLLTMLALLLVIEGFLPALSPRIWRQTMFKLMQYHTNTIRYFGLGCMVLGAVILYLVRNNIF